MSDTGIDKNTILVIGIGNSGRSDDGLGWRFIESVGAMGLPFLDLEFRYQLQVEDAALISQYETIIFVDASYDKFREGFQLKTCVAASHSFFFSHAQMPEAILCLTNKLYERFPTAYTLAITGRDWDLRTSLSKQAENNLQAAVSFFMDEFLPTIHPVVFG